MPAIQMLTVRIPTKDLKKLDKLAVLQGRPRSQLVQEAVTQLVNNDLALSDLELKRLKRKLAPAVKEQCALLDGNVSFADTHRSF